MIKRKGRTIFEFSNSWVTFLSAFWLGHQIRYNTMGNRGNKRGIRRKDSIVTVPEDESKFGGMPENLLTLFTPVQTQTNATLNKKYIY